MMKPKPFPCAECGKPFSSPRHRKLFCSTDCQKARNRRTLGRGAALSDLLMAYRVGRSRGDPADREAARDALRQVWRLVADMVAEDRAAGRIDPVKLFRRRSAAGLFDF